MKNIWSFKAGNKSYTSLTRSQLKKKRKALRYNPTFTSSISDIIPINFDAEKGEARMPIIYVATIKKVNKNASP
jgi:hypothetical protein